MSPAPAQPRGEAQPGNGAQPKHAAPHPQGPLRKHAGLLFAAALLVLGIGAAATGLLPYPDLAELAGRTVPILLFVIAMTVVTELAAEAGLFRALTGWLAARGARGHSGKVWVLWIFVLLLSTLSTVFLSLDTTAVLVTPVVVLLALRARIPPLPFALTTVWLANTASLFLPVSNLTNLLAQSRLGLKPVDFLGLVWAPAVVGLAVPALLLWLIFRRELGGSYKPPAPEAPTDKPLLVTASVVVILLLPALVSGVLVAIPSGIAALLLLAVFAFRRRSALSWRMLPYRPIMLAVGLFLLVQTLQAHGLGTALAHVSGTGTGYLSLLQLGAVGALAANGINNLPGYLALEPVAGSPLRLAALLIGVNLGPLITPWASLATLLWHERLVALGVRVSWGAFALAGLAAVVLLLPLATLALWLTNGLPG